MMIRSGEKLGEEKLSLGCPSRIQERQCGRRKKGFERWMKVEVLWCILGIDLA